MVKRRWKRWAFNVLFERMVLLHQSYGTPRVVYTLQTELERHHIYSEFKVSRKKKLTNYQLWIRQRDAEKAREVLEKFKGGLLQA